MGDILGIFRDNGKENGIYHLGFRFRVYPPRLPPKVLGPKIRVQGFGIQGLIFREMKKGMLCGPPNFCIGVGNVF